MITSKMKKWLEVTAQNPQMEKSIKYCVYMNRIQKRIEKELDALLWLAIHYPKILLDEEREYRDEGGKIVCHRRLKKLLLSVKALNPKMEVELVLKNLDFPESEPPTTGQPRPESQPTTDAPKDGIKSCEKCGLSPDLCVCKEIEKELQRTNSTSIPSAPSA
jgi:hypothetical protein